MEVILSRITIEKDQMQYVFFNVSEDKDPGNQLSQLHQSILLQKMAGTNSNFLVWVFIYNLYCYRPTAVRLFQRLREQGSKVTNPVN